MKAIVTILLSLITANICCKSKTYSDETSAPSDTVRVSWTKDDPFPFNMPSKESLNASDKKVFAHYFTQFPIAHYNIDASADYYTLHYLTPSGEGGIHAAYGGFLRNRPLPRAVISDSNWQEQDMEEEVRRAIAIGLDGFACNLLSEAGTHRNITILLMEAAHRVDPDFKILIMPDMEAFWSRPEAMTQYVKDLSAYPSAYRLGDGRLVISPFNTQRFNAAWWENWLNGMRDDGIDIAFVPLFQSWQTHAPSFGNISYGMSDWGWASPKAQIDGGWLNAPSLAHQFADIWMHPVRPQDFRPHSTVYWEAGNSELYRVMWDHAISGGADWVHLITWNDYSEHACIAPSTGTQYSFYDLTAYYTAWFKTGVQPPITHDALYYFHRRHNMALEPTVQTARFQAAPGSDPQQNTVELLAFLTAPATLEIQIGATTQTMEAPAGITSFKVTLRPGIPVFRMKRIEENTLTLIELPGAFEIKSSITCQDPLYYGGSSTRPAVALDFLYKID